MDKVREQIVSASHKKLIAVCLALTCDDRTAGEVSDAFAFSLLLDNNKAACTTTEVHRRMVDHPYVSALANSLRRFDLRGGGRASDKRDPSNPPTAGTYAPTRSPKMPSSGRSAGRPQTAGNQSTLPENFQ
jgi:hypothetical protein